MTSHIKHYIMFLRRGKMSNNLIVKHNKVIEGKYNMTPTEAKLVAKLTSMIEKEDEEFKDYTFKVKNLLQDLGLGENYTLLKKSIKKLITREIEIEEEKRDIITTILSSCVYDRETSTIILSYDPKLKPYFLQLKENFTKYYLENILELKSFYSIRIYELLKQYQNLNERTTTIKDLKKILNIKDKYELYGDFKRRIIKPAVEEINDKTDLKVDFEEIKTGRKVTSIMFLIKKKNNQHKIENEEEDKTENSSRPSKSAQNEFSDDVEYLYKLLPSELQNKANKKFLGNALDQHEKKYIVADIKTAKEKNNIDNFIGYLKASLKKCIENEGCGNGGHFGNHLVSEQEKKKNKKEEKEKQKIIDELESKAKKESYQVINNLSEKEKEEILEELDYDPNDPFKVPPERVLQGYFYNKILKKLKNEYIEDFNQKQSKK